MLAPLRRLSDRVLGRGSAAITVPVMDGALKPNRWLDEAEVVAELPGIDDLASDGDKTLWASAGPTVHRLEGSVLVPVHRFDAPVTALAVGPGGLLGVALGGASLRVLRAVGAGWQELAALADVGGSLVGVNALAFDGEARLVFSEGSRRHAPADWCRDLMELGASGRVCRWNFASGATEVLASGLQHAFGVLAQPGGGWRVSESWRHRVVSVEAAEGSVEAVDAPVGAPGGPVRAPDGPVEAADAPIEAPGKPVRPAGSRAEAGRSGPVELPGYPSRMTLAAGGGFWLSCFVCRTQLVEFVLREPAYRKRMLAEIDPRYWIAPALASGQSFLEPLQGAGVKTMGVMKPWAPPRSYGLVLRVAADGHVLDSLHSQVDGRHHGITGIAEHGGRLHAASKGSGRLLALPAGVLAGGTLAAGEGAAS